jgi:hypothetical protein
LRLFVGIVVAGAAIFASGAAAHDGKLWYQTAANTSSSIPDKYPSVALARCQPIPPQLRAQYHAHSMVQNDARYWDHLLCNLVLRAGGVCVSVAHITGQHWDFFST